jgi:hypothetical protein
MPNFFGHHFIVNNAGAKHIFSMQDIAVNINIAIANAITLTIANLPNNPMADKPISSWRNQENRHPRILLSGTQ